LDDTAGLEQLLERPSVCFVACADEFIAARRVAAFFVFSQTRHPIAAQLVIGIDAESFAARARCETLTSGKVDECSAEFGFQQCWRSLEAASPI
jgi:hypothetical protein